MKYKELKSIYYKDKKQYLVECQNRKNSISSCLLDINIGENDSFIVASCELMTLIENIYSEAMKLEFLCSILPKVTYKNYARKCLIDEIILTNDIEGVSSTRKEVIDVLESVKEDKKDRFNGLIKKYALLMETNDLEIPLNSCEEFRMLYDDIVLDEVKEDNLPDGEIFRKSNVVILSPTQKQKHQGIFPETKVQYNMTQALNLLKRNELPNIVKIAALHYFIGYIHPFYDGNGRLSRFISSYLLSQSFNPLVAYRLSYTINNNKDRYYKAFDICNDQKNYGDITPFVITFLEIVFDSIRNLIERLTEGKEQLTFYGELLYHESEKIMDEEKQDVVFVLVQKELFSSDAMGVNDISAITGFSNSKVRRVIQALIDQGVPIVVKREGRKNVYDLMLDELVSYLEDTSK